MAQFKPASQASFPAASPPASWEEPLNHPSLSKYLHDLRLIHGFISVRGLQDFSEDGERASLSRLFVEPRLADRVLSADAVAADPPPATLDLFSQLKYQQRLVILGDPGSGKSTLLDWICLSLSEALETPLRSVLRQDASRWPVPLPFILRDLVSEGGGELSWESIQEAFLRRPVARHLDAALLTQLLRSGQAMVLLDGLDEIAKKAREALYSAFIRVATDFPQARFVLTSRIVGYNDVPFDLSSDPALGLSEAVSLVTRRYLAPFNDAQIAQFSTQWWERQIPSSAEAREQSRRFLQDLRAKPDTLALARVPNLLTLFALVYRVGADFPGNRSLLYALIAQAYLDTIDRVAKRLPTPIPYSGQEMERWLARIAWRMQCQRTAEGSDPQNPQSEAGREPYISRADALREIEDALRDLGASRPRQLAESFLDYAARRSGLFLERGPNLFAFIHLSFLEYFAAQYLVEVVTSLDWISAQQSDGAGAEQESEEEDGEPRPGGVVSLEDLRKHAKAPLWLEVLSFLFESLSKINAKHPRIILRLIWDLPPKGKEWNPFIVREDHAWWTSEMPFVRLVATLAVNIHVSLRAEDRQTILARCWKVAGELREQGSFTPFGSSILLSRETTRELSLKALSQSGARSVDLSHATLQDEDLDFLAALPDLRTLDLSHTAIGDPGLRRLQNSRWLTRLLLDHTQVTDDGLQVLSGFEALEELGLGETAITDAGLRWLSHLSRLQALHLPHTAVGDPSIGSLEKLTQLSWLDLTNTRLTSQGLRILGTKLKCEIRATPPDQPKDPLSRARRFRIALSFAGELRDTFVKELAGRLAEHFGQSAILYDAYQEAEIARARLGHYLSHLYGSQSDLNVIILCEDYRSWVGLEPEKIADLLKSETAHVLLCRFGEKANFRDTYLDAPFVPLDNVSPESTSEFIVQHLDAIERPGKAMPPPLPTPTPTPAPESNRALEVWESKLKFLQHELAAASSPAEKFELSELVDQARSKVKNLEPRRNGPPLEQGQRASDALNMWKGKLEYLQRELAITSSASQKFELDQQIAEAQSMIRALGGGERTALQMWKEKLEYLQREEVLVSNTEAKFQLKELIHEANEKIRGLSGRTPEAYLSGKEPVRQEGMRVLEEIPRDIRRRLQLMTRVQFAELLEEIGLDRSEFSDNATPAERLVILEEQITVYGRWPEFWEYVGRTYNMYPPEDTKS